MTTFSSVRCPCQPFSNTNDKRAATRTGGPYLRSRALASGALPGACMSARVHRRKSVGRRQERGGADALRLPRAAAATAWSDKILAGSAPALRCQAHVTRREQKLMTAAFAAAMARRPGADLANACGRSPEASVGLA